MKIKRWIAIVLVALGSYAHAFGETLVTYGGTFSPDNTGYQAFCAEYPSVKLEWSKADYYPASAFVTALLLRDFRCDLFIQGSNQADWHSLMTKGFCVDLSDSAMLNDTLRRMHPSIAEQGMVDGRIYAIPTRIGFTYLQIDRETWTEMGYSIDQVPQSFPSFLDFLSSWCDRIEQEPESEIVALGGIEEGGFPAAYTTLLVEMLIDEAVMQKQYLNDTLDFHEDELVELLKRCAAIGDRLAQLQTHSYTASLFEQMSGNSWPASSANIVYLRIHDSQPKLIRARVSMWGVNADSDQIELSKKLLEKAAVENSNPSGSDDLFLYQDAKPRIDPDYEAELARWEEERDAVATALKDEKLSVDEKERLENELAVFTRAIVRTEANKWLVSPEQLDDYQHVVNRLYFPPLNVFESSAAGHEAVQELYEQYAYHRIEAATLLHKLNEKATMMQLEE